MAQKAPWSLHSGQKMKNNTINSVCSCTNKVVLKLFITSIKKNIIFTGFFTKPELRTPLTLGSSIKTELQFFIEPLPKDWNLNFQTRSVEFLSMISNFTFFGEIFATMTFYIMTWRPFRKLYFLSDFFSICATFGENQLKQN